MSIITLTSDLGSKGQYLAILKGVIYTSFPEALVVDVSHEIPNYDILEAAFILRNTYPYFPKGSVHLIAIDPEFGSQKIGILMELNGHFFVAPDNGICSLIAGSHSKSCYLIEKDFPRLNFPRSFRVAEYMAPAATWIAQGNNPESIGSLVEPKELLWGEPIWNNHALRGKIIHIDKFGNAITNIHKELFLALKQEKGFEIFLRNIRLKRIVSTYSDVSKGDALAIFGIGGYLEVAMRESSAVELLGLKVNDMITIEFK